MKITVIGNVGKDAELRKVNNGGREDSVCSFWIAENISKRDKTQITRWHKVTIWRGYAETLAQYLKSGRKVLVTGVAQAKCYTNKQNQIVPYIDIQADEINLLDGKKPEGEPEETETPAAVVNEDSTPWD
jgi:single-strand DNA-binding protein